MESDSILDLEGESVNDMTKYILTGSTISSHDQSIQLQNILTE